MRALAAGWACLGLALGAPAAVAQGTSPPSFGPRAPGEPAPAQGPQRPPAKPAPAPATRRPAAPPPPTRRPVAIAPPSAPSAWAHATLLKGEVQCLEAGRWRPVRPFEALPEGRLVRTGPGALLELSLPSGQVLRLGPDSQQALGEAPTPGGVQEWRLPTPASLPGMEGSAGAGWWRLVGQAEGPPRAEALGGLSPGVLEPTSPREGAGGAELGRPLGGPTLRPRGPAGMGESLSWPEGAGGGQAVVAPGPVGPAAPPWSPTGLGPGQGPSLGLEVLAPVGAGPDQSGAAAVTLQ